MRQLLLPIILLGMFLSFTSLHAQSSGWQIDSTTGSHAHWLPAVVAYNHKLYVFGNTNPQIYEPARHRWDSIPVTWSKTISDIFATNGSNNFGAVVGDSIFILFEYTKPFGECLYRDTVAIFAQLQEA